MKLSNEQLKDMGRLEEFVDFVISWASGNETLIDQMRSILTAIEDHARDGRLQIGEIVKMVLDTMHAHNLPSEQLLRQIEMMQL